MITNLEELCAHVGTLEPTWDSLAHAVYKGTDCGAWVAPVLPECPVVRVAKVRVRVLGAFSVLGFTIHALFINGKPLFDCGRPAYKGWPGSQKVDLPIHEDVLVFLNARKTRRGYDCDMATANFIRDSLRDGKKGREVTVNHYRGHIVVRCRVDVNVYGPLDQGGVQVGSIVEGCEGCAEPITLRYPFPKEDWGAALGHVEADVDRIRKEAGLE
jgi:hypothetical protein